MFFFAEDRQIYPEHSVEDNLLIAAKKGPKGEDYWTLRRIYDMLPLLEPLKDRMGGRLSGGEQQMLTIGRTLMGNPTGLLLDEPSEGLAPVIVEQMAEAILVLKAEGVGVLLAEQNLRFAARVADRAAILETGRIVWQGTIAALMADEAARARHLQV